MSEPVTAESLTYEQVLEVQRTAVGALYIDCLDATTGGLWIEARGQRLEARTRIAAAINARRKGGKQ